MLKILQARLQQYVNRELPDVQVGFQKGRGTRDQIANIHWITEKAREFQKKHLFLLYWRCQSPTLCNPMDYSTPGLPVLHYLLNLPKFMFIALVMPSSHLISWCPLLLLPSIFPSIRDFSNESSVCIRWPKYWSFSFSISPSNEYSGLIYLKIDWSDLLAAKGTLRSILQHHSLKASILWHSAFFMAQFSQPYVTTGKTIALTIQTFVNRVMSPLFNTLSRFVTVLDLIWYITHTVGLFPSSW